jgi:DNA-binding MarR family transcriptional regulator
VKGIDDCVRELLLAYERLDSSWRREFSLSANEKLVLMFLHADGPMSPTRLAAEVGLTTAGMSTLLDRLEHEGFVTRTRMTDDRRRVLVSLAKRALKARMRFEETHRDIAHLTDALSDSERRALATFLERATSTMLDKIAEPQPR